MLSSSSGFDSCYCWIGGTMWYIFCRSNLKYKFSFASSVRLPFKSALKLPGVGDANGWGLMGPCCARIWTDKDTKERVHATSQVVWRLCNNRKNLGKISEKFMIFILLNCANKLNYVLIITMSWQFSDLDNK